MAGNDIYRRINMQKVLDRLSSLNTESSDIALENGAEPVLIKQGD